MSNARIFAWGWIVASLAYTVSQWFGFGGEGLFAVIFKAVLGCHVGVAAVAIFGDRQSHVEREG